MNQPEQRWSRLVTAARVASDPRDTSAPYGFATRVAALANEENRPRVSLVERFSWRALAVACLLALVGTVVNYSVLNNSTVDDENLTDDGTVSALLDIT